MPLYPPSITGSGTINSIPKWSGAKSQNDSIASQPNASTIQIGIGAAATDYALKFKGNAQDGFITWSNSMKSFHVTANTDVAYDYPSASSLMTVNATGGNESRAGFYASILATANNGVLTGFWGGYVDSGASAFTPSVVVGASGWNYLAATNVRTIGTIHAGQFANELAGTASNLTLTLAQGIDVSSVADFSGTATATVVTAKGININDVNGAGISVTDNYGLYINSIIKGTNKYSIFTNLGAVQFGDSATITRAQNASTLLSISNTTLGTAAVAGINFTSNSAAQANIKYYSSGFTSTTTEFAQSLGITTAAIAGITIAATNASPTTPIRFFAGGTTLTASITENGIGFGTLATTSNTISVSKSLNSPIRLSVLNTSVTGAATMGALFGSGTNSLEIYQTSTAFTPSTFNLADASVINAAGVGGLSVTTSNASGVVRYYIGSSTLTATLNSFGFGVGLTPSSTLVGGFKSDQNAGTVFSMQNATVGTAAFSGIRLGNNSTNAAISYYSTSYTSTSTEVAGGLTIQSNGVGGMTLYTASDGIKLFAGSATQTARIINGSVLIGNVTTALAGEMLSLQGSASQANVSILVKSNFASTTSTSSILFGNDAGNYFQGGMTSTLYTPAGAIIANQGYFYNSAAGGLFFGASNAAGAIVFSTNTSFAARWTIQSDGTLLAADAINIAFNTTTGTKIGTATTQKIGFFNATPIVQVGATIDLGVVLSNLGLRAAGTAYTITTSGATNFTGAMTIGGQVTVSDAINFALNTANGTKFGTGTTQKIGFLNSTPVSQQGATIDLGVVLSNFGFRAAGTAYTITTSGATNFTGAMTVGGQVTVSDAINYALGTTTGTKWGTATTQKQSFWNATPVVQPTNGITAQTFVANTSGIINDTATFGGYTLGQIAAVIRQLGLAA